MLNPLICGEWDGCSVWLQWDQADAGQQTDYEVRLRCRTKDSEKWDEWMNVVPRQGSKSHWAVIPLWREGWQCEAEVRTAPTESSDEGWEKAREVTFSKSSALFEFVSDKYDQHLQAGSIFNCQVDAAACAYVLAEEVEIKAGTSRQMVMDSVGASGYFQLDYSGHFEVKPSLGFRVYNVEPSKQDVAATGREFTVIKAKETNDPVTIAIGRRNRF